MMERRFFDHLPLSQSAKDGLLKSQCYVTSSAAQHYQQPPPARQFTAMWDTGSNISMVSHRVISLCGLIQEGVYEQIAHPNVSVENVPMFHVELTLPNRVNFPRVPVARGNSTGWDVLIGMNIISQGDLLVLSGGRTTALFRYPSVDDAGSGLIPQESTPRQRNRSRPN